ncbi:helix-turn-helix domain-containing protein [Oceanobacillus manasiensis]|uniref:helix-turn-helix domain-containing protein n=1 Tax=Oceanobacillus manasiensis TaxID=586413 RepID=UPI0005A9E278|nr:helix-turn-helix transcriptional regulator [Oceanobacillus manasiensis]
MKNIGQKIRYYRIQKGMTQAELTEGIISHSYLSKIENGGTSVDPEIIALLCNKLKITPQLADFDSEIEICKNWFKKILEGNKKEALILYDEIINNSTINTYELLGNLIELNKLRFYMLTKQEGLASRQIKVLNREAKKFTSTEKYYWLKFKGEYKFFQQSYNKALIDFQEAEKLINDKIYFKEEEENDLFYLIGLTASKIRQVHLSLVYTYKALKYYQSKYNLYKCAQCHILLGISYRRSDDLENSKRSYEMSKHIGEAIKDNKILYLYNQNMGSLYSSIGMHEKAINYFNQSYELRRTEEPIRLIVPISSIMKEYYKMGDHPNAIFWLSKGIDLSSNMEPNASIYLLEFKVYEQLLLHNESPLLEKLIVNRVFPFMEERKLFFEKRTYELILAEYYYKKKRYKLAADYYRSANITLGRVYCE